MTDYEEDDLPPHNRTDTSIDAARKIKKHVRTVRNKVLKFLNRKGGALCKEAENGLGPCSGTVTARINELCKLGFAADSGIRRPTGASIKSTGKVWVITDAGKNYLS